MEIKSTFSEFLVDRRNHIDSRWTSWEKFYAEKADHLEARPDEKMAFVTLTRLVRDYDGGPNPKRRNAYSKDSLARALGFLRWTDIVKAWESGRDASDIPTDGLVSLKDGQLKIDPAPDDAEKKKKRRGRI